MMFSSVKFPNLDRFDGEKSEDITPYLYNDPSFERSALGQNQKKVSKYKGNLELAIRELRGKHSTIEMAKAVECPEFEVWDALKKLDEGKL